MIEHNRREEDKVLAALNQQVRDFLYQYAEDQRESKIWRVDIEGAIATVQGAVDKLMTPYKIIMALATFMGGAFFMALGKKLFDFIASHVR